MSKIIETSELMELAAIDGEHNKKRVEVWQKAAEAEIVNFTDFNIETATNKEAELADFIALAKIYLQETARIHFLAPNYPATSLESLKIRLSSIAEELKENGDNGI